MAVQYFQNKFHPNYSWHGKIEFDLHFPKHGVAFATTHSFFAAGLDDSPLLIRQGIDDQVVTHLSDWIRACFGGDHPVISDYEPGTFYKRIWRPFAFPASFTSALPIEKVTSSFISLRLLLNKLEALFATLEPAECNKSAYGHALREIILLACMEVESSWSAVLKENEYLPTKERLTTKDYVKLKEPMLLEGYHLSLRSYPSFAHFSPFETWDRNKSTHSLAWYDAYNKIKHDRESNLHHATLLNAIHAVGAATVMFHAQFGFEFGDGRQDGILTPIRSIFDVNTSRMKNFEKEYYIPQTHPFRDHPTNNWTAVSFRNWRG